MMKSPVDDVGIRLNKFLEWWSRKVEKGSVSAMDRVEISAIAIFIDYDERLKLFKNNSHQNLYWLRRRNESWY